MQSDEISRNMADENRLLEIEALIMTRADPRIEQFNVRLAEMTPAECHAEYIDNYKMLTVQKARGDVTEENAFYYATVQGMLYMKADRKTELWPSAMARKYR